uniref:Uncharacterized protein At2g11135/T13H18.19 n=1 Tax=Arabidopsis thaliana TaxID=3702 RepID=Q84V16_ARATH|nr:hypothetical protein [Arabidopsis thaliana]
MFWCVFRCKRSLKGFYSTLYCIQPGGKQRSNLLDQFTRSRQLPRRQKFTRLVYSIKAATKEATYLSTCPSYSILYSTPLLDQGRPTLQDLLIYQSVFGSSSFLTQPDI